MNLILEGVKVEQELPKAWIVVAKGYHPVRVWKTTIDRNLLLDTLSDIAQIPAR